MRLGKSSETRKERRNIFSPTRAAFLHSNIILYLTVKIGLEVLIIIACQFSEFESFLDIYRFSLRLFLFLWFLFCFLFVRRREMMDRTQPRGRGGRWRRRWVSLHWSTFRGLSVLARAAASQPRRASAVTHRHKVTLARPGLLAHSVSHTHTLLGVALPSNYVSVFLHTHTHIKYIRSPPPGALATFIFVSVSAPVYEREKENFHTLL